MTEHYITLFDSAFLPQGLALHSSLQRHGGDFHLWILAMDNSAASILQTLELHRTSVVPLAAIEGPELLAAKLDRSTAEYCWTVTPFTPDVVFERDPQAERATYVDADVWLLKDPRVLFRQLENSGADALITPHAYADKYASESRYGEYCVQFMPFERRRSIDIRRTWQSQCLDWCYSVPDNHRFGDQKYLDAWPKMYGDRVEVLQHPEWTQAPWNAQRFSAESAVTYHFHRLRLLSRNRALLGLYAIPADHLQQIYRPYLDDLRSALDRLDNLGVPFIPQTQSLTGLSRLRSIAEFRLHNLRHPTARRWLRF